MKSLTNIGRISFGITIAGMGLLTIYYRDFPYMLIPPKHSGIPGLVMLAYISGALLILAGASIVFEKKIIPINTGTVALLLGGVLLSVFCFYFIPYQLIASSNYMHFGDWENAAKELTLAGGALVIAGCFSGKNENALFRFLSKLIPLGAILFALTIISFAGDHYLYAKAAADYVPSWIPFHLFWIYFTGASMVAAGLAIATGIQSRLAGTMLGVMFLLWVLLLHAPRVFTQIHNQDELTSLFVALAFSGSSFIFAAAERAPK